MRKRGDVHSTGIEFGLESVVAKAIDESNSGETISDAEISNMMAKSIDGHGEDCSCVNRLIRDQRTWAHILLLIAQICFSGWHIVGSVVMKKGVDPFVFVLYREGIAASIMYILLRVVYKGEVRIHIDKEDRLRFAFLGFCSFVNVVGAMLALKYISATRFAIFQPSIPCIATFISIAIGLERFTLIKITGIALAVSGAILSETWKTSSDEDKDENLVLGTVIVVCQVIAMATLVVTVKPVLNKYHPAMITLVYYSIGTCLTVILFLAFAFQYSAGDIIFNGELLPWLGLAYVALFATVYPYNALSWAGKRLSPSMTTVYSTFQPVGTILLSFVLLGKVVSMAEGVGTAMVIAGLLVTVFGQRWETMDHRSDSQNADHQQQLLDKYGHDNVDQWYAEEHQNA